MYPFSTKILYGSTIFSKTITNLYRLQAELASVCSACNHFLQINLSTILFSGIFSVTNLNVHGCALPVTIVYKYTFLWYYCFQYIIGNLYMFKTDHASMCSACTHISTYMPFTVILFSVKLSEIVDYNQYMHQFALQVTTFYKNTFLQQYYLQ